MALAYIFYSISISWVYPFCHTIDKVPFDIVMASWAFLMSTLNHPLLRNYLFFFPVEHISDPYQAPEWAVQYSSLCLCVPFCQSSFSCTVKLIGLEWVDLLVPLQEIKWYDCLILTPWSVHPSLHSFNYLFGSTPLLKLLQLIIAKSTRIGSILVYWVMQTEDCLLCITQSFSHALWNVEQKALRPKKLYLSIFSETLAVFFVETFSNYIFILPVHAWIFSDLIISCYSSQPKHLQKVVLMNLQTRKARRNNLLRLQRKRLSFSFQVDKWISVFYFILFLICNIVDLVLDGIKASMMKVIC